MDSTTLVILMGVIAWGAFIWWAMRSYRRKQEARELERTMRYQELFGSVLLSGNTPATVGAVTAAPSSALPVIADVAGGSAVMPDVVAPAAPGAASSPAPARVAANPAAASPAAANPAAVNPAAGSAVVPAAGMASANTPALAATAIDPSRLATALMAAQPLAGGRSSRPAARTPASSSAALMPDSPILPAPAYQLRERVLDKASTLALYVIRTAMPDHEVLVGVSLARLLDVPDSVRAYDRELRLKKLAPLTVDFAITSKSMQLVAVIDLEDAAMNAEQRDAQRAKAEYLRAFPIRYLTFSRANLPKYQEIRQLLQRTG